MEEYYELLGIQPTASTDDIEEAYKNKKLEFDPSRFEQGSPGWNKATAMQAALDKAYNDAIMATFAPIRASGTRPAYNTPVATIPIVKVPTSSVYNAGTVNAHQSTADMQLPIKSSYIPPKARTNVRTNGSQAPVIDGLVQEVSASFTDEELLKMDIDQFKDSFFPKDTTVKKQSPLLTLGIEDPMLRAYAWTYIGFVLFDIIMVCLAGAAWREAGSLFTRGANDVLRETGIAQNITTAQTASPSFIWSLIVSVVSNAYMIGCSFVFPFIVRFYMLGQSVDKLSTRWMINTTSILPAYFIYWLTGKVLFLLLPPDLRGTTFNLCGIAPIISGITLKY